MSAQEYARLETTGGQPVMLSGVKLTGDIRGSMFEAVIEQRFINPTATNVEVVYTFPLPWGAVLLGIDVLLGNKQLVGAVVIKNEAEARYEEAISEGDAAIMLEKNRDQSYSLNLGNLAPKESCVITMRYAQVLKFEQGGLRLLIPTVIAPRYGDEILDGGMKPHQVTGHSLAVEYPFELEISLHGVIASASVSSPSHPTSVSYSSGSADVLKLSLASEAYLDRDFILVIDDLTHDSIALMARDCVDTSRVALLASFCPRIIAKEPIATAMKILVDCSGSMAGDSIEAARRALLAIVQQLGEGDRFSLSRFGSTVEHRSRGLWKVSQATRLAACRWVNTLDADLGGTEMESALESTFALAQTVSSDVMLVTDGEISGIESTIRTANKSGHRLFVVGIGSSPAESHLRRLAEATGGACDFVAPGEAVEPAIMRMFGRLRSPRLTGLSMAWPDSMAPAWMSPLPVAVFDGDTVNVFALLDQPFEGEIRLQGRHSEDAPVQTIGTTSIQTPPGDEETLSRLVAAERVKCLKDPVDIALSYQLVTDFTSFLLIHLREGEEKATDMPELHQIRQMVPAGWSGIGSVRMSTMTVTERDNAYSDVRPMFRRGMDTDTPILFSRRSDKFDVSLVDEKTLPSYQKKRNKLINRFDTQYWITSDSYTGLTSLGAREWLRLTPVSEWPTSYAELLDMGLGSWVVEWLELTIGAEPGIQQDEEAVVTAFLHAISSWEMAKVDESKRFQAIVKGVKSIFSAPSNNAHVAVDHELARLIITALTGLRAHEWPEQVYGMDMGINEMSKL